MTPRIEQIDTRHAPESTLRALHQLYLVRDREDLPDDPPMPEQQRLANWRHIMETDAIPRWVMWEGDSIVATSGAHMDVEQNLDNGFGWVYVAPDRRGRGLSRQIARPMFDTVDADNRARFACDITEGRAEEAIARRGGLKPALREKRSRLAFHELDWDLMESWVARSRERASDYELIFLPSPVPEEHLQAVCDVMAVMNTAPREEFEEDDEVWTPDVIRDYEAKEKARGQESLSYFAIHRPTGVFAGVTIVTYQTLQPDQAWQGDTGVDPAHRNRGIGRWLKAAMALHLRSRYADIQRIDTHNAGSNEPMLNINIEMGFRPILTTRLWQGDLATLREQLSV